MSELKRSLQDEFLHHICKHKLAATVFLTNGVKLQGVLTGYDDASVLLRRETHVQLIFKHAISTIMPNAAVVPGLGDALGGDLETA